MIELLQFYKIKSCKKKEKFLWKEKIKYKIIYIIKKEKKAHSTPFINVLEGIIFLDDINKMEKDLKEIAAYKVEDLMSTNIVKVHEDDTFDNIANIMIKKSVNRVPVVDKENRLKGIICRYDIIRAMYNE